jgi:hypothetical protein
VPLHVWIEPEYDEYGCPTGLYGVFGDESVYRYGWNATLQMAWEMAKQYDPEAVLKKPYEKPVSPLFQAIPGPGWFARADLLARRETRPFSAPRRSRSLSGRSSLPG